MKWTEAEIASTKYPDLDVKHEVCLDFILWFFAKEGVMPSLREVQIGMGYQTRGTAASTLDRLFFRRYLEPLRESKARGKCKSIRRFGPRVKDPIIRVLFEKISIGPLPRKMTAKEAMRVGWLIYDAGEKLKRIMK